MPHPKLKEALEKVAEERGLEFAAASRINAWLEQAESGEFAAADREEQLQKILSVLPGHEAGES